MEESVPQLIEKGSYYYLHNTLQKCHDNRINVYIYAFNITIFILFVGSICIVLYYCYYRKLSPEEAYEKRIRDQEYILSKIRFYKDHQQTIHTSGITNLPKLDPNTPFI
jgi:hypothetical protein